MSVQIEIDPISHKRLNKRFKLMGEHYPKETFNAIIKILFDMKTIAQKKIKSDGHIVTSRLRNSLFVKTPRQRGAKRATNSNQYTWHDGIDKNGRKVKGGSGSRSLSVNLKNDEGAFGTNVIYANKIEKLDSFVEYAAKTVDVNKRFREIPKNANKKIK